MNRTSFFYVIVILSLLAHNASAADWKAGVAKVNITPKESQWLAGYAARDHASEGVLMDLWAKALILEDAAGHRSLLVTTDLIGFPKDMSDRIRKQLSDKLGLDKSQIILNASHTHSGPVLSSSGLIEMYPLSAQDREKIEQYSRILEQQIVDLAVKASQSLEPVTLAAGNGIARIQVNRRNNAEGKLTSTTELKGPHDCAVPVLKVTNVSGQVKAIAFGYACHPTVLDIYRWSGDYPGFTQAELEKWYPGAVALFFQGAGADQNPLPRRTIPLAKQYGITLAAAVDRVLQEEMKVLPATLKTAYAEVMLPLELFSEAYLTGVIQDTKQPWCYQHCAQFILDQLHNGQVASSYPFPVQAWNVGGWALFTLGGELTVGYAVQLKQKYGVQTFVLGYTNDVMGYIPTVPVLKEGGYEGASSQLVYGLPGQWTPEIESIIYKAMDGVAEQAGILPQDQR